MSKSIFTINDVDREDEKTYVKRIESIDKKVKVEVTIRNDKIIGVDTYYDDGVYTVLDNNQEQ